MDLNKAKKDIRRLTMTAAEKQVMVAHIVGKHEGAISTAPIGAGPIKSPYAFFAYMRDHRMISSAVALVLIMALAGGGVTYAAEGSLPGSPLYTIKTRVVEPLQVALAPTAAAKAEVQVQLAQTRLAEAETLAVDGNLDTGKQLQIATLLQAHTNALAETLVEVSRQSPEQAEAISANFSASMDAHADVLTTLDGTTTVAALSSETQAVAQSFSRASFDGKGAGKNKGASDEQFSSHRKEVQVLIQTASSTLDTTVGTSSPVETKIIEKAHKAVERAAESLHQADQEDSGGTSSPDESLQQSRTSADEANILLKVASQVSRVHDGHGRGHGHDN